MLILLPQIIPKYILQIIKKTHIYCLIISIILLSILVLILILIWYVRFIADTNNLVFYVFNNNFRIDYYVSTARLFILFIGLFIILSIRYPLQKHIVTKSAIEFTLFIIIGIWYMLIICSTQNFLGIYFCIEALAILLYILSATNFETENFGECTNKYFTMSVIASALILVGILLIYLIIGSLRIPEIFLYLEFFQNKWVHLEQTTFLFITFILSFLIKLGCFPGHKWVPDVYESCSLIVMIYFATIVKFAIFIIFIKIFIIFIKITFFWQPILYYLTLISILIGTIATCGQTVDIKRFIAFTSITQAGYVLIGFCFSNTILGISASITYLYIYILSILLFFIPILHIRTLIKKNINVINITDLQKIAQKDYRILIFILIALGSMSGIPPFLGFFAKLCFLDLLITESYYILFFCIIICSCISTYNYIKILTEIFARPWSKKTMKKKMN